MYSLRRVLAVRFSITMFVALLLVALWAFLGTQGIVRGLLDRSLASAFQLESAAVTHRGLLPELEPTDLPAFIRDVNRFVVLRDVSGRVIGWNTPLAADLPYDPESLSRARAGVLTWRTEPWAIGWVRSAYGPAPVGAPPGVSVIQVAASLGPVERVNRNVLVLMLGTVVLGTVATSFGAGWMGRAAVEPVLEIEAQANRIVPGVTGQRITAHADVAECAGLVRVLNLMLERLDRAHEAQRRIIADVGHDLKTPLTAMRGELEIALRGDRSPEAYRAVLKSVLEDVDHLQSIGEALLMLARVEAGALEPRRRPTDLTALAQRSLQQAAQRLNGRLVRLLPSADSEAIADVDEQMISLALDQFLDNVTQHTPPGGQTQVEVAVAGDGDTVRLSVADNGPGIPDEALPHLFERFYRFDAARTRGGGAGLGLTVAAAVVAAHGGSTHAARSRLGGLEVGFTLPRATPDAPAS